MGRLDARKDHLEALHAHWERNRQMRCINRQYSHQSVCLMRVSGWTAEDLGTDLVQKFPQQIIPVSLPQGQEGVDAALFSALFDPVALHGTN